MWRKIIMKQQLNNLLSNLVVEYHKLQNFHWYVKGKDFFQVHAKLEDLYNGINGMIDEVAENMLMEGIEPVASLKEFLENSSIQEASAEKIKSKYIFKEVLNDFNIILNQVIEIKKLADEQESYLLSASMDEYIKEFKKSIWMINQVIDD